MLPAFPRPLHICPVSPLTRRPASAKVCNVHSPEERATAALQEGLLKKYGAAFNRTGWWELHNAVFGELPPGTVSFDRKFAGYAGFSFSNFCCFSVQPRVCDRSLN